MEELVEDDICILNHEKADNGHKRDGEIPVSAYSGDESVASHFALVTAYEDIKKRLKETEKENSFLKKRVRILEEKLLGSRLEEECSSVGREQVNRAYQAYREACIDRDNLKSKLDKMMKETAESLKNLNEQLQSKEVELLQLKTEVETQQGTQLLCLGIQQENAMCMRLKVYIGLQILYKRRHLKSIAVLKLHYFPIEDWGFCFCCSVVFN
uniref:5-azacytidine induced 2 n=1 Tax=Pavo cristatus TaxID=9049 RepID=A0A8C9EHZ8_PAVCR